MDLARLGFAFLAASALDGGHKAASACSEVAEAPVVMIAMDSAP